jgi:hypothetical protein
MVEEARLEDLASGLAPVSPGWFVVNAGEAAWLRNDSFGGRCYFESNGRVVAERPDVEPQMFTETGFTLAVLEPGKPTGMFHAESAQENFFVLAGTCARARRRGRDGDAEPARGVRTVRALAPGAAGRLARAALGRMRPWIACVSREQVRSLVPASRRPANLDAARLWLLRDSDELIAHRRWRA